MRKELNVQQPLLCNNEELFQMAREYLESIKVIAGDLGIMHTMKENLSASSMARDSIQAKWPLNGWIAFARA